MATHLNDGISQRVVKLHFRHQYRGHVVLADPPSSTCRFPRCNVLAGPCRVVVSLAAGRQETDGIDPAASFDVVPRDVYGTDSPPTVRNGVCVPDAEWNFTERG